MVGQSQAESSFELGYMSLVNCRDLAMHVWLGGDNDAGRFARAVAASAMLGCGAIQCSKRTGETHD